MSSPGQRLSARVELTRLNALLSLMPPPERGPTTPAATRDLFDHLVTVVTDAAEARAKGAGAAHRRVGARAGRRLSTPKGLKGCSH